MRQGIRVVVQGRSSRRRAGLAHGLWAAAEIAVTLGVVVLLLVVHQLWWTNRQAREGAEHKVQAMEREWGVPAARLPGPVESGAETEPAETEPTVGGTATGESRDRSAAQNSAPRWDQAYAILRVPRLGVVAPVAQGIGKRGVLDKGYVGHYPGTAQPGEAGNFAVAGHRNTHGEPFRHINRLRGGDEVRVETREGVYLYVIDASPAQTSPRDTGVIAPVPRSLVKPSAGYSEPGHYLTLTTCTPEFSSKYRLVVWGKLSSMRPR
ncbi:class E sortase [Streptomyces sp. CA-135486]|uniref:class E sortase n=1 Tax=Streptomyces sp. CA-135486 TaxID=3240049 RepID=UPI003D8EEE3C